MIVDLQYLSKITKKKLERRRRVSFSLDSISATKY